MLKKFFFLSYVSGRYYPSHWTMFRDSLLKICLLIDITVVEIFNVAKINPTMSTLLIISIYKWKALLAISSPIVQKPSENIVCMRPRLCIYLNVDLVPLEISTMSPKRRAEFFSLLPVRVSQM